MNYDQYTGIVRAIVPALIAWLVAKGYLTDSVGADVGVAIITVAAAVWSVLNNKSGKIIV